MNFIQDDMKEELIRLSQEFDCLGLPTINVNVDILYQLVTSISKLIHMYRQSIQKQQENKLEYSVLRDDLQNKQKKIESMKDEMKEYEKEIKQHTSKILMNQLEINSLKSKLNETSHDLERSRKYIKKKENELGHKISKLQLEINKFKDEPVNNGYLSKDEKFIQTIHKYKLREEIYKDAVKTMQENNEELQHQILNLKHEILLTLSKQDLKS